MTTSIATTHTPARPRLREATPEQVDAQIRATVQRDIPLPAWPAHLPVPTPTYGISECGADKYDMWLNSGDRKVYFQIDDATRDKFYDDINDDPDWANETTQTRNMVIAYGHALLKRYDLTVKEAFTTPEGRAFTARVWSLLA